MISPLEHAPKPDVALNVSVAYREGVLADMLGTDYEFALSSGLLDWFDIDENTGEDALEHILGGSVRTSEGGGLMPGGFHHEPSAIDNKTYVDRGHIAGSNSQHRKNYRENRYEPYNALSVIRGYRKVEKSTMFPKEYDALTVMQTIVRAVDGRDTSKDIIADDGRICTVVKAALVDGQSKMDLRVVINPGNEKIVAAYPIKVKRNVLGLGHRAISYHDQGAKDQVKINDYLGLS